MANNLIKATKSFLICSIHKHKKVIFFSLALGLFVFTILVSVAGGTASQSIHAVSNSHKFYRRPGISQGESPNGQFFILCFILLTLHKLNMSFDIRFMHIQHSLALEGFIWLSYYRSLLLCPWKFIFVFAGFDIFFSSFCVFFSRCPFLLLFSASYSVSISSSCLCLYVSMCLIFFCSSNSSVSNFIRNKKKFHAIPIDRNLFLSLSAKIFRFLRNYFPCSHNKSRLA